MKPSTSQIAGMYFVLAAIGEMRVNREDIVGWQSDEVKYKLQTTSNYVKLKLTKIYQNRSQL